ncbi:alcohol dehydrogenase [Enterobacter cloacae]|uniref:Alcohol dehydrogenase n=1 Tax=Enterobacter cloacae TaxID=550 RepID=A0A377M7X5_ENTCL|nr:alcohol dehydrogenase [Enterobacter cloacae]
MVNYRDLQGELAKQGITFVDYIFILNDTDGHWDAVSELIAPQGHICSIVENAHPLNQDKLKSKSAACTGNSCIPAACTRLPIWRVRVRS